MVIEAAIGDGYLELGLKWSPRACLHATLCSRQLEQLSLEPPGAQGSGFQCED